MRVLRSGSWRPQGHVGHTGRLRTHGRWTARKLRAQKGRDPDIASLRKREIEQSEDGFVIAAERVGAVNFRSRSQNYDTTPAEIAQPRSVVRSVGWEAYHFRPDRLCQVSRWQTAMRNSLVKDLIDANRVRDCVVGSGRGRRYPSGGEFTWADMTLVARGKRLRRKRNRHACTNGATPIPAQTHVFVVFERVPRR